MNLRTVKPLGPPRVFLSKKPFSNFTFRDDHFPGCNPLGRILSQARRLGFKAIVMEKIPAVGFAKSDDLELKKSTPEFIKSELFRLSFLKRVLRSPVGIKRCRNDDFLGYAILKGNQFRSGTVQWIIFESIVTPPRHDNNYLHSKKSCSVRSDTRLFKIRGNLYCQQNGITNVCAHVALRTIIASLTKKGDVSYREINRILEKVGLPHPPKEHLSTEQIKAVLENKKIGFYEIWQTQASAIPYQKYLYGSIEIGYPALLGFHFKDPRDQLVGHIIPVIGHTFNEDTWVPNAESSYFTIGKDTRYVPSEAWVSTYICHDDNFGSNYCIPRLYVGQGQKIEGVYALGTLPRACKCDPIEAEAVAVDYLYSIVPTMRAVGNQWVNRLKEAVGRSWVVLRPVLISGEAYVQHLKKIKGWGQKDEKVDRGMISILSQHLHNDFWVVEVSFPELFPANRRKLGEIVLRSDIKPSPQRDYSSFILARLPGSFLFMQKTAEGVVSFVEIPSGINTHSDIVSISM